MGLGIKATAAFEKAKLLVQRLKLRASPRQGHLPFGSDVSVPLEDKGWYLAERTEGPCSPRILVPALEGGRTSTFPIEPQLLAVNTALSRYSLSQVQHLCHEPTPAVTKWCAYLSAAGEHRGHQPTVATTGGTARSCRVCGSSKCPPLFLWWPLRPVEREQGDSC